MVWDGGRLRCDGGDLSVRVWSVGAGAKTWELEEVGVKMSVGTGNGELVYQGLEPLRGEVVMLPPPVDFQVGPCA